MPPVVIDVAAADDLRDVVHRAVQALAEGQLVVLPTETVYGVASIATDAQAVAKLAEATGRDGKGPFALAVKSAEDAEDYAPGWNRIARRLARRCWPGPVTLVVEANREEGLVRQLPEGVLPYLCPEGTLGMRAPANRVTQDILRMLAGPIALTSVGAADGSPATTAEECAAALGDSPALILDDGPSRYGQTSSVVTLVEDRFDVLREGVVGRATLERLSRMLVVFVCTGNTCRSPMAEALMRDRLSQSLGVEADELEGRGVIVTSAGLAAAPGGPASPQTVELMRERGISLETHGSQQLTEHLARQADLIIALTPSHAESILGVWPETAPRVRLLDPDGASIADPIGGPLEVYRLCSEQIERGVNHHAETILAEISDA